MAKINEDVFEKVSDSANLKAQSQKETEENLDEETRTLTVYSVPQSWFDVVKSQPKRQTMAAFAREAIYEKLKKEGLI